MPSAQPLPHDQEVFSFLENLVDVVARGTRSPRPLPQWIGEALVPLLTADFAAVYLVDKKKLHLMPEWVATGFPALFPLPKELQPQAAVHSRTPTVNLVSFLKLSAAPMHEGILAECFRDEVCETHAPDELHGPILLAPLRFGSVILGVLAVARQPDSSEFDSETVIRFQGLAAQCGFALGTALMREEASEKRKIDGELQSAREVQRLLLPEQNPVLPGFEIAGKNLAARVVSGDYYDFIPVDADHLGLVIADVSGKGIPASLVMATCRGLLRGLAPNETSPTAALSRVNRSIYEDMREDMFISAAYVMLRPSDPKVTLSRAGHDAPLLYKQATNSVIKIESPGLAMGLDDGDVFDRVTKDYEFEMHPGDCLLLYTDGVNEAENAQGIEFGLQRLEQTFILAAPHGAKAVLSAIKMAVAAHIGKSPQNDDVTMIVVQRLAS